VPTDEFDEPRGADKYAVMPWFDQIDQHNSQVLGKGRAGKVTNVRWHGQDVALKTFVLQPGDSRSLGGVYRHELGVLLSLRQLWGIHVPKLLFHKP
jgi:hypothetical protein